MVKGFYKSGKSRFLPRFLRQIRRGGRWGLSLYRSRKKLARCADLLRKAGRNSG